MRAISSSARRMRYSALYRLPDIHLLLLDLVLQEPLVGLFQSRAERRSGLPAERPQPGGIKAFERGAVRFRGIETNPAAVTHHVRDRVGNFGNPEMNSAAQVDWLRSIQMRHHENTGISQVGRKDELSARLARAQ